MKPSLKTLSCAALAIFASVLVTGRVRAGNRGAFAAGSPLDGTPMSCYAELAAAVTGTGDTSAQCRNATGSPRWTVPMPVLHSQAYTVTVSMKGSSTVSTCCRVYAVSPAGVASNSNLACSTSTAYELVNITSPTVPVRGYMYLSCSNLLTSANAIETVEWSGDL